MNATDAIQEFFVVQVLVENNACCDNDVFSQQRFVYSRKYTLNDRQIRGCRELRIRSSDSDPARPTQCAEFKAKLARAVRCNPREESALKCCCASLELVDGLDEERTRTTA